MLALALCCTALAGCGGSSPKPARLPALHAGRIGPESMFTIVSQLTSDPVATIDELQRLGVQRVHVSLPWASIAPDPQSHTRPAFDATDPSAYPAASWAVYDRIVRDLAARHIGIDLALTAPPPFWAQGSDVPRSKYNTESVWKPDAAAFGQWVTAVGKRYSGSYTPPGESSPLPRVNFWSVWNEPNLGTFLAPEAKAPGSPVEVAPRLYRSLVDQAWTALHATGHGGDTILIGELAPTGVLHGVGLFNVMPPLRFLRALYCVNTDLEQLQGTAASVRGCPATRAASARFAAQNPGLFEASGFAVHPYPQALPPDRTTPDSADDAELAQIPNLERLLDRVNDIYGSHTRFPIWATEYGYITNPPNTLSVSIKTAALYLNWSEYITWSDPRIKSYDQYLLDDPPAANGFTSGLDFANGKPKSTYAAYRMPLYLPVQSTSKGDPLVVWGQVRPAPDARKQTHRQQSVEIQFQAAGGDAFKTVKRVALPNPNGYFEVRQTFPSSGDVRLRWTYPDGTVVYSRTAPVTLH